MDTNDISHTISRPMYVVTGQFNDLNFVISYIMYNVLYRFTQISFVDNLY